MKWSSLAVVLTAAFFVAIIAQHQMLLRLPVANAERVGVPLASSRTDLGDNYLYFSLTKRGASACRQSAEPDDADPGGNALACTYLPAIIVNHFLLAVAYWVLPSPRLALVALLLLDTTVLAAAFCLAVAVLVNRRLSIAAAMAMCGFGLLLVDSFGLTFYTGHLYTNLRADWSSEPNPIRLLNPSIFWAMGLVALATFVYYVERPKYFALAAAAMSSFLLGASSISVALSFGLGMLLCFTVIALRRRECRRDFILVGLALGVGLAWQMFQFRHFWASELGSQINTGKFAGFSDLRFNPTFVWFALPICLGRITGSKDKVVETLAKCVLGAAALVGAFCNSVDLGSRLWIRGADIYALACTVSWLWVTAMGASEKLLAWASQRRQVDRLRIMLTFVQTKHMRWISALSILACLIGAYSYASPVHTGSWRGYIDREKYDALEWLNAHTRPGETVASTDIEDSFLIDFYTHAEPFRPLYGLTALPFQEMLMRHVCVMELVSDGQSILKRLKNTRQDDVNRWLRFIFGPVSTQYDYDAYQAVAFYWYVVYYPFNAQFRDLFASGSVAPSFVTNLDAIAKEAPHRHYHYRYLIVRTGDALSDPSRFHEVFRNRSVVIYEPKAGPN
ncbi:MAG: hypothetical protein KGJ66_10835 [Alphaproteobacteria bacterium]|nr:hypothetical protein [Alphaproteobacteria bacterium]